MIANRNKTLAEMRRKINLKAAKDSGRVPYKDWIYFFGIGMPKKVRF